MSNTLAEYKYLGPDADVRKGIALTIVTESPWLQELPFVGLANNNISKYKMEVSDGGATVHEVGDTWVAAQPTWEDREASLAILGQDADDDKFGSFAAGGEDTMAAMIELKSKAVAQLFEKLSIYGRTTSTAVLAASKNFKGLLRLIAECESDSTTDLDGFIYTGTSAAANNKQAIFAASGASAALSLVMLDALIDTVRPKPSHLIMSRLMRRKLVSLAQATGNNLEHDKNQLGYIVSRYGEQTVLIDDQIVDNMNDSTAYVTAIASYDYTQAATTDKDTSPIFAVRFGEDGLCGINGEGMIQVEKFDKLEGKDARRVRIKFYAGMRLTNKLAAAVLLNANYSG